MSVAVSNGVSNEVEHIDKTVNRAFRLDRAMLTALQEESRLRNMTVNAIINELVTRHVTVDLVIEKYHPVVIGSLILKLLCDAVPEERVVEIATESANQNILLGDFPEDISRDDSAEGILRALKTFCRETHDYEYSEEVFGGKRSIIMVHDAGKNWSLFTATYWKNTLSRKGVNAKIFTTEKAAVLQFREADIEHNGENHRISESREEP